METRYSTETSEVTYLLQSRSSSANDRWRKCGWTTYRVPAEVLLLFYFSAAMTLVPVEQLYVFSRVKNHHWQTTQTAADTSTKDTNTSVTPASHQCFHQRLNLTHEASENVVQVEAASWLLVLTLSENVCAMIATCLLGACVDTKGRKLGIIVPMVRSLLKVVVFIAVLLFELPVAVLIFADVVEGASGYYGTVLCAVLAHLADVTASTKQRATRINTALALNGIGIGLTYLVSGLFIAHSGFLFPLLFSLTILLISIPVTIFLFPETLTETKQEAESKTVSITELLSVFRVYQKDNSEGRQCKLLILAVSFFSFSLVITGRGSVQSLYQLNFPLCWSAVDIGYFGAAQTLGPQLATLLLFPTLRRRFTDIPLAVLGTLSSMAAALLQTFATVDLLMYLVAVVGAFQMFVPPTVKTMMSSLVGPHEQGAIFASVGIIQMVCSCVAQVLFNSIYAVTLAVFPGTVFLIMAGFLLISTILLITTHVLSRRREVRPSGEKPLPRG